MEWRSNTAQLYLAEVRQIRSATKTNHALTVSAVNRPERMFQCAAKQLVMVGAALKQGRRRPIALFVMKLLLSLLFCQQSKGWVMTSGDESQCSPGTERKVPDTRQHGSSAARLFLVNVSVGDDILLCRCRNVKEEGQNEGNYKWSFNGSLIDLKNPLTNRILAFGKKMRRKNLKIAAAMLSDAGAYTCSHPSTNKTNEYRVTVYGDDVIRYVKSNKTCDVGQGSRGNSRLRPMNETERLYLKLSDPQPWKKRNKYWLAYEPFPGDCSPKYGVWTKPLGTSQMRVEFDYNGWVHVSGSYLHFTHLSDVSQYNFKAFYPDGSVTTKTIDVAWLLASPPMTAKAPTTATRPPTTTPIPPSATARPPTTTARPPTTTANQPSTAPRLPSTMPRPPTTTARPPTKLTTAGPPTTTAGRPSTTAGLPSTTAEQPTTTAGPPSTTAGPPSTTAGPPTTTARPPSTTVGLQSTTTNTADGTLLTVTDEVTPVPAEPSSTLLLLTIPVIVIIIACFAATYTFLRKRQIAYVLNNQQVTEKQLEAGELNCENGPTNFKSDVNLISPPVVSPPCLPIRPASLSLSPTSPSHRSCTTTPSLRQQWPIGSLPYTIRTSLNITADEAYEVDRWRILPGKRLGEGEFGDVWKGVLMPEKQGGGEIKGPCEGQEVAIKALKEELLDSRSCMENFYREMELLKTLKKHKNLINLIGVCTSTDGPLFMIFEYCQRGSLQRWLRRCQLTHRQLQRLSSTSTNGESGRSCDFDSTVPGSEETLGALSENLMLQFAHQIASGMAALAEQKVVHRDLATRNVLMTWDGVLKIADFGLSRDLPNKGYYRMMNRRVVLPFRWMAPEAMPAFRQSGCVFSEKSDVWSYGITLWEIASLGKMPFSRVPAYELHSRLVDGYRLSKPTNCPQHICDIMDRCWLQEPAERPTFAELEVELEDILINGEEAHPYLEIFSDCEDSTSIASSPTDNSSGGKADEEEMESVLLSLEKFSEDDN